MPELDDDDLLEALGVEVLPITTGGVSAREERLIAGFDEILQFQKRHGREPRATEDGDIFERLYGVRLARLRTLPDAVAFLSPRDSAGLLTSCAVAGDAGDATEPDDEGLLAALGVQGDRDADDITTLRHVESHEQRRAAEEIATRAKCQDFDKFQPLFEKVERELRAGVRKTVYLKIRALEAIRPESFFIVGGQMAYIADVTDSFTTSYDRQDSRLRVVYDNATESDLLQRSFQRALHRDELARVVTDRSLGPLFGGSHVAEPLFGQELADGDVVSGTIYVLRSRSEHPVVAEHRELVHKIGVTNGKVETRISQAKKEATYLLADVEIVATYALANINPIRLENLFHRLFSAGQLDLTINDRFGNPVRPREWFLVPLHVIDEAVSRIQDGTIIEYEYSPSEARLVRSDNRE